MQNSQLAALKDIELDMSLHYTEPFWPDSISLQRTRRREAIRTANDTEYGSTWVVFTEALRRGLKIARRIKRGAVHINRMTVHQKPAFPRRGAKKSGFRKPKGEEGLNEWVR